MDERVANIWCASQAARLVPSGQQAQVAHLVQRGRQQSPPTRHRARQHQRHGANAGTRYRCMASVSPILHTSIESVLCRTGRSGRGERSARLRTCFSLSSFRRTGSPVFNGGNSRRWGAVVAQWLGYWTQDSRVVGSIPTPGMVRF